MKKVLLCVLLLLSPVPTFAQEPVEKHKTLTHALIAANATAHFADLAMTQWAMGYNEGRGKEVFREANPLLGWAVKSPTKMALVKGAGASLQTYIWLKWHKKKPKTVIISALASTLFTGYVAHRNADQIRKIKN